MPPKPRLLVQVCFISIKFGSLGASQQDQQAASKAPRHILLRKPSQPGSSQLEKQEKHWDHARKSSIFRSPSCISRRALGDGSAFTQKLAQFRLASKTETAQYPTVFKCILKHHLHLRLNLLLQQIFQQIFQLLSCWAGNLKLLRCQHDSSEPTSYCCPAELSSPTGLVWWHGATSSTLSAISNKGPWKQMPAQCWICWNIPG